MVLFSEGLLRLTVAAGDQPDRVGSSRARRGPVVLATDGTGRDGAAVVAAQSLAERLHRPLEVISVVEPNDSDPAAHGVAGAANDSIGDELRRIERETVVRDYVSRFTGGATPPRIRVRFGSASAEVSRFALEVSAATVVEDGG